MNPNITVAALDAQVADVAAGIGAAELQLRHELMTGGDTRAMRTFLDAQRRDLIALGDARGELVASIEDAAEQRIAAAGAELANEVIERLRDRLAPLRPPPSPLVG